MLSGRGLMRCKGPESDWMEVRNLGNGEILGIEGNFW